MILKISGKNQSAPPKHLIKNNTQVTNIKDIADTLAETFSANYSSTNSNIEFHKYKDKKEKQKLNFKSNNTESYNELQKSHNTADEIHYEFLRQLPPKSLEYVLTALNDIWKNSKLSESWKLATIIPIPKPRKNNLYASNYHPITLTSCLCKTMEQMVNKRLVWFIEPNNLFTNFQCGFRSWRSTRDQMVKLETSIWEAIIQKQHLVAIFFDLEKAYETTWRYCIMNDLHNMGLKGRLLSYQSFSFGQEILSLYWFNPIKHPKSRRGSPSGEYTINIKINSITNCLNPGVDKYLFIDNFCITSTSKYTSIVIGHQQN